MAFHARSPPKPSVAQRVRSVLGYFACRWPRQKATAFSTHGTAPDRVHGASSGNLIFGMRVKEPEKDTLRNRRILDRMFTV